MKIYQLTNITPFQMMCYVIKTDGGKGLIISSAKIPDKATRSASGTVIIQLPKRGGVKVDYVTDRIESLGKEILKCRKTDIGHMGTNISQMTLDI